MTLGKAMCLFFFFWLKRKSLRKTTVVLSPVSAKSVRQNIILLILLQSVYVTCLEKSQRNCLPNLSHFTWHNSCIKVCLYNSRSRKKNAFSYYLHLPNLLLVLLVSCLFCLYCMKLQMMFLNQQILHQIQKMSPQHASEKLSFLVTSKRDEKPQWPRKQ